MRKTEEETVDMNEGREGQKPAVAALSRALQTNPSRTASARSGGGAGYIIIQNQKLV
jgi:hypothetical protein